ncbi:uncharacterized protein [Asterias amurensis]|uniref:uncharacterized protein n=1 Tax=Asterias amurensis TaxID=7602 RepID=UPI003AB375FF
MAARVPARSFTNVDSEENSVARGSGDMQKQPGSSREIQGASSTSYQKRERSQNWDHSDKCLLVKLVQKRLAVIENKAGDTVSVRQRKQAWKEVYNEFSVKVGGVPRELQRIREQWRRIKHWARQEMNYYHESEEQDLNKGGATPTTRKPNELAKHICELMSGFEHTYAPGGSTGFDNELQEVPASYRTADGEQLHPQFIPYPLMDSSRQSASGAPPSSVLSDDDAIPVTLETVVEVKQEPVSVDLVGDEDQSDFELVPAAAGTSGGGGGALMVTAATTMGSASLSATQIRRKRTGENLPSWTKDFPGIIGEGTAQQQQQQRPHDDDDDVDDNDSDFLDEDDSDDDIGSLSDWGQDNPVGLNHTYDGGRSSTTTRHRHRGTRESDAKFERQRLGFARREFKRRMQMMESQHARKMQILELRRETELLKKKIVFRQLKQHRVAPQANTSNSFHGRHGNSHR